MYYLQHTHPPSASAQATLVELSGKRYICVVHHTSLSFHPLDDSSPLSLPINARIVKVVPTSSCLLILTDHHRPRLIAVSRENDQWKTVSSLQLDELGRQPAEGGMNFDVQGRISFVHTYAGVLKVAHLNENGAPEIASAFSARTPHPHLISSVFLSPSETQTSPKVALLSLSSIPSRLPGLGMQCLPVLSFHAIDEAAQELTPVAWGPSPKLPPSAPVDVPNEKKEEIMPGTFDSDDSPSQGSSKPAKASSRHGPEAMGATKSAEEQRVTEHALASSSLAKAHVPLPFADALGAHLLLTLPARAGGGVLVFCETSILHVPPPSPHAESLKSPMVSTTGTSGKRRKASTNEVKGMQRRTSASTNLSTSTSSSSVPLASPTSGRSNENGKRRRSTAGSSSKGAQEEVVSPSRAGRRRSSATLPPRLLRVDLGRPVMVASATVVSEPSLLDDDHGQSDDGIRVNTDGSAKLHVLFGTHSGQLELLEIGLESHEQLSQGALKNISYDPSSMNTSHLASISQPGGPHALAYLGENFVYNASATGDSTLLQVIPQTGNDDDTAMNSMQGEAEAEAEAEADGYKTMEVKRWSNIAPVLDFVADDGDGGSPSSSKSAQARVITCSGTGPTGSLRAVRNGVAVEDVASLQEPGVRRLWPLTDTSGLTRSIALGYPSNTRFLTLDPSGNGFEDATSSYSKAGLPCSETAVLVSNLTGGKILFVTEHSVITFVSDSGSISQWSPESIGLDCSTITAASSDENSQVLLALHGGHIALLDISSGAINVSKTVELGSEASSIDVTSLDGAIAKYAAVSLWSPAKVILLQLPTLEDVTPSALASILPALPRSVLLHTFSSSGPDAEASTNSPCHLFVGLGDGTLCSYALDFPMADSFSSAILVTERRTASLGSYPLRLRPFTTSIGLRAVFVACDRPTVLFAQGPRLTYSAVKHRDVTDVGQLNTSANVEGNCLLFALGDELLLSQVGAIQNLDVRTIPLGIDNPLAIAQSKKVLGVATWRFLAEGSASAAAPGGKIILMDHEEFERLDEFELERNERPNCIEAIHLEGEAYLVAGTGIVLSDRAETTEGRLLGFRVTPNRKLSLAFSNVIHGNVSAVVQTMSYLAVAVNSEVLTFAAKDVDEDEMLVAGSGDERPVHHLVEKGKWASAFTAITLSSPKPGSLVVGDALRSIALLQVEESNGAVRELARDCDPYWTTAAEEIDEATYIGADIAFNIYTSQRLPLTEDALRRTKESFSRDLEAGRRPEMNQPQGGDGYSHVMERRGAFHYGDMINKFRRGSLISKASSTSSSMPSSGGIHEIDPKLIFVTAAGAIGIVASLGEKEGRIASEVERNLNDFIDPIGGITSEEWRALRTDHRVCPSAGFIDGDLLGRFATLTQAEKDIVLSGPKSRNARVAGSSVDVASLIEALGRLS